MLKINYVFSLLLSALLSVICAFITLPILKRLKAGQPIYHYVKSHEEKNGTPTMGGLFFIIPACIVYFIFCGFKNKIANFSVAIGLAFLMVGFLDDFIKIKLKRNQGLKAYQKIIFQLAISIFAGVFAYLNGYTNFNIPFTLKSVSLGYFTIPFVALIFIAVTNCVNLTDGLDGLAGGTCLSVFAVFIALIFLQINLLTNSYLISENLYPIIYLCFCLVGCILAFLLFNTSKAKVFMGDTGSLSLGGFIASVAVFSGNSLFIPITGIMFVVSGISVIIQVLYYKKTKRRIFLMAPFHHHLQMKKMSEAKISYIYFFISLVFGLLCLIVYL